MTMAFTAAAGAAKQGARPTWRPLLRTAGMGFVGGVIIWGVGDVVGELTTFIKLREKGILLANNSQELKDQIGYPFSVGPWYQSGIGFAAGGNVAQCTFQLQGAKQITDVTVRCMRGAGTYSRALYNLFGPGTWTVIDCTAMFPSGGGLVQPRSLLPKTVHEKQSLHHEQPQESPQGVTEPTASINGQAATGVLGAGAPAASLAVAEGQDSGSTKQQGGGSVSRTWWGWIRGRPKPPAPNS